MQEKIKCTKCLQEKDFSEFSSHRASGGIYKRRYTCRECYNQYFKNYLNNDKHRALVSKKQNERRQEIAKLKTSKGCCICGYSKCSEALEFHHLDRESKTDRISRLIVSKSSMLSDELEKCVILCANCHREVESGITTLPLE